jgi:hypothetical protein
MSLRNMRDPSQVKLCAVKSTRRIIWELASLIHYREDARLLGDKELSRQTHRHRYASRVNKSGE